MNLEFKVNEKSKIPIYKQLAQNIMMGIDSGEILYNEKLPTERELATHLKLSRGTIKKAYEFLCRASYVQILHGSGTYVSNNLDKLQKNTAKKAIDDLLDSLFQFGFSCDEILSLVNVRLFSRTGKNKTINIAAIDCNVETLDIFKNQLTYIENINYMEFLLEDVVNYEHQKEIFEDFDLIFTTTTHYDQLINILPSYSEKIVKAVVSPDKDTVVKMANIPSNTHIGILTKSKRFAHIIKNNLKAIASDSINCNEIYTNNLQDGILNEFLQNRAIVIIPPLYSLNLDKENYDCILEFIKTGGDIITFNYTIERGSLLYLEEKITYLLKTTGGNNEN